MVLIKASHGFNEPSNLFLSMTIRRAEPPRQSPVFYFNPGSDDMADAVSIGPGLDPVFHGSGDDHHPIPPVPMPDYFFKRLYSYAGAYSLQGIASAESVEIVLFHAFEKFPKHDFLGLGIGNKPQLVHQQDGDGCDSGAKDLAIAKAEEKEVEKGIPPGDGAVKIKNGQSGLHKLDLLPESG
jgi:hypothetical protein